MRRPCIAVTPHNICMNKKQTRDRQSGGSGRKQTVEDSKQLNKSLNLLHYSQWKHRVTHRGQTALIGPDATILTGFLTTSSTHLRPIIAEETARRTAYDVIWFRSVHQRCHHLFPIWSRPRKAMTATDEDKRKVIITVECREICFNKVCTSCLLKRSFKLL